MRFVGRPVVSSWDPLPTSLASGRPTTFFRAALHPSLARFHPSLLNLPPCSRPGNVGSSAPSIRVKCPLANRAVRQTVTNRVDKCQGKGPGHPIVNQKNGGI